MKGDSTRLLVTLVLLTASHIAHADSGKPAKAAGPLRVHPANPRYFTDDSRKAVYLTGSHNWTNLMDRGASDPPPAFDFDAYLDLFQTDSSLRTHMGKSERKKGLRATNCSPAFQANNGRISVGRRLLLDYNPKPHYLPIPEKCRCHKCRIGSVL